MSALTLALRQPPAAGVDMSPLTPDLLAGKTTADIARLALAVGRRTLAVDELFDISGDDPQHLVIRNSTRQLHRIGATMRAGQIEVYGDAGDYAGLAMQGGTLTIHGDAGIYAAGSMHSGLLRIHGNAADHLAAAIPGAASGLQGGTVMVEGDAGHRAADRMRRGLLYIKGNAGDYCASRMIAGTVVVLGEAGAHPAFLMRRGTLLLARSQPALPATFNDCGVHTLPFLTLLQNHLLSLDSSLPFITTRRVRRLAGDLAAMGKGEILIPQADRH